MKVKMESEKVGLKLNIQHYFPGNVLFPGKGGFNKAGGCVCPGVPASVGSLVIFSLENSTPVFAVWGSWMYC